MNFLKTLFHYSPLGILKDARDAATNRALSEQIKQEAELRQMAPIARILNLPTSEEEAKQMADYRSQIAGLMRAKPEGPQQSVEGPAQLIQNPDGTMSEQGPIEIGPQISIPSAPLARRAQFIEANPNLNPDLSLNENIKLATIFNKRREPSTNWKQQTIPITNEMEMLAPNFLKSGSVRKGFEIDEAFKQTRQVALSRLTQDRLNFQKNIRTLPPQSLIDDVANVQYSADSLDNIENMARQALAEGTLPVGRVEGYLSQGKQFFGLLTEEEAKLRTEVLQNVAMTLRQLGGTALTKTEKETFEEALPLLTNSPTEFFARLSIIRENLLRKKQALIDTSASFGRQVPGAQHTGNPLDKSTKPKLSKQIIADFLTNPQSSPNTKRLIQQKRAQGMPDDEIARILGGNQ